MTNAVARLVRVGQCVEGPLVLEAAIVLDHSVLEHSVMVVDQDVVVHGTLQGGK